MALVKQTLSAAILQLLTQMRNETEIDDSKFADGLADAIDAYIKTAEVPAGIPVSTTGSPTAQTGATTAPAKLV